MCILPGADDCFGREVVRGERPRGGGGGSPMREVKNLWLWWNCQIKCIYMDILAKHLSDIRAKRW